MMQVSITVNGHKHEFAAAPMKRLLDVLRENLGLTGTKEGCGEGECGACAVMLDGLLVQSCMVPACQVQGRSVLTIEGVAESSGLHPLQKAFHENSGAQCGMCTPGMIIAALYYLKHPDEAEDIREALAGNQCRCTGYIGIFKSIEAARSRQKVSLSAPLAGSARVSPLQGGDCITLPLVRGRSEQNERWGRSHGILNPRTLDEALDALAANNKLVPLAGATDLMVYIEARTLPPSTFLGLQELRELESITFLNNTLSLGAMTTYRDVRLGIVAAQFPLLALAAREIG